MYEIKSFNIVKARHRNNFNFNTLPNRSQIFKLTKKIEAHWIGEGLWGNMLLTIWVSNQQGGVFTTFHETMLSAELWTSGANVYWLLLIFLVHFWHRIITDSKMVSFYLLINVIFVILSFMVRDLWNTLYVAHNTPTASLKRLRTPPHECRGYDTKQSDGEIPVKLELWGMWSTLSLSLLPGRLSPEKLAPDKPEHLISPYFKWN